MRTPTVSEALFQFYRSFAKFESIMDSTVLFIHLLLNETTTVTWRCIQKFLSFLRILYLFATLHLFVLWIGEDRLYKCMIGNRYSFLTIKKIIGTLIVHYSLCCVTEMFLNTTYLKTIRKTEHIVLTRHEKKSVSKF